MTVRLVVDASVALKWLLDDEEDRKPALALLSAFRHGKVTILVPPHWPAEVLNGIRSGVSKGRFDEARATELGRDFTELEIGAAEPPGL
ncbi:type II toxin-antitoxin system VapC family toxin [Planctomycetota bacterium]